MRTLSKLSLLAAATLTTAAAFAAPTDVHPPAGYATTSTWANGVSADGLTYVGYSAVPGQSLACKIVGTTLTTLNPLSGHSNSIALAASANGSLIVGYSVDSSGYNHAVAWTGSVATNLDPLSDYVTSEATAVSADGTIIYGWGFSNTTFLYQGFYHQGGAITPLGFLLFPTQNSKILGVSADGNMVVGSKSDDFSLPTYADGFVHGYGNTTIVQAHTAIPAFASSFLTFTQLTAISGNGAIAVGYASSSLAHGDEQAFTYTVAGGAYAALGTLSGGSWSKANAINHDGTVIVGQSENSAGNPEAFVYQNGTMTGLGFLANGSVSTATGVSADGAVIVGYGNTTGGYTHAFVYANQVMLDETEWMRSLNGPGSLVAMTTSLSQQPLEGAHHRPLMSYDSMGKQNQAWATGDFGASSRQSDRHTTSGEMGVSGAFGDFVLGVAAGHASLNQDLLFGGNASISGNYLLAEADYRLADKESIVSLVLMRGDYDASAARGYVLGSGAFDASVGSTGLKTTSARLRLDGPAQKFMGAVSATPFVSYTATRTTADAYAEAGGAFPASFAAQEHTAREGRLGVTAKYAVSPATTLLFTAEWIHRFDDAGDGLSGDSLTTSSAFAVAGVAPTANQARFGLDIDHRLSADTLLNFSVHAAGTGASSDLSGAISVRRAF